MYVGVHEVIHEGVRVLGITNYTLLINFRLEMLIL